MDALLHTDVANQLPAWAQLEQLAERFPVHAWDKGQFDLREAFQQQAPQRVQQFSQTLNDDKGMLLHVDYSKAHIDTAVQQALYALAEQRQLLPWRDAMFNGEQVNATEQRQVMHWLLRCPSADTVPAHLQDEWREMAAVRSAFLDFAETVRANPQITDVVNIGIGGSDLGPRMAVQALGGHVDPNKRFHFVSNIDGHEIQDVLAQLQPQHTLFIVASKTFTTLETMTNARTALAWFKAANNGQYAHQVAEHFIGITTNQQAVAELGLRTTFGFKDWVGGRYSMWSAIGLSLAIALGKQGFEDFLAGAHAVDQHFLHAAPEHNLPINLGLLDVWYASFLNYVSRCTVPYHSHLQAFPAYLQQLEMESNGKGCDRAGRLLHYQTAGSVWGEPGSNGQHAFFQLLHQSPATLPIEFVAVKQAEHPWQEHHHQLLANALAQAEALMVGRQDADPQRCCPGNRPSTFMVLEALTPRTLGALIALYEQRVFVAGVVWGINSFDQFGVELGKQLAKNIYPRFASGNAEGLDASTADLLRRLR